MLTEPGEEVEERLQERAKGSWTQGLTADIAAVGQSEQVSREHHARYEHQGMRRCPCACVAEAVGNIELEKNVSEKEAISHSCGVVTSRFGHGLAYFCSSIERSVSSEGRQSGSKMCSR